MSFFNEYQDSDYKFKDENGHEYFSTPVNDAFGALMLLAFGFVFAFVGLNFTFWLYFC